MIRGGKNELFYVLLFYQYLHKYIASKETVSDSHINKINFLTVIFKQNQIKLKKIYKINNF